MNVKEILRNGEINNKKEYYFLYGMGFFGNRPLTWNSIDEIIISGWKGGICIRGSKGIPRIKSRYNLTLKETIDYINQLKKEGIPPEKLTFNQSMPDEHLIIQGEVVRDYKNYSLTYTTIKKPMNRGLEEETLHAEGIKALFLLKQNLFPSSYDDLQILFDIFSDSVIEFSSYDIEVGNLQNRNTIIWEVRNY